MVSCCSALAVSPLSSCFGDQHFGDQDLGDQDFGDQDFGDQTFGYQGFGYQDCGNQGPTQLLGVSGPPLIQKHANGASQKHAES